MTILRYRGKNGEKAKTEKEEKVMGKSLEGKRRTQQIRKCT